MMMMMASAKQAFSLISINLWQTGVRSLWGFYRVKSGLSQDDAWAELRIELEKCVSHWVEPAEEWEFQLVRAILVEEHNVTVQEGNDMYNRDPGTPLLDALKTCIARY